VIQVAVTFLEPAEIGVERAELVARVIDVAVEALNEE
jgi:hypothetical protein